MNTIAFKFIFFKNLANFRKILLSDIDIVSSKFKGYIYPEKISKGFAMNKRGGVHKYEIFGTIRFYQLIKEILINKNE